VADEKNMEELLERLAQFAAEIIALRNDSERSAREIAALKAEAAARGCEFAELEARLAAAEDRTASLAAENAELRADNADLRARLAQDSSNSSKPPSQDGLKPAPRPLRRRSGRKPGGQVGHKGATLEMVDNPDRVEDHRPASCAHCGEELGEGAAQAGFERRQVFDIPPVQVEVTEHRLHSARCAACGKTTKAEPPSGARAQVQYGPNLLAFAVYLSCYQHIPFKRAAELVADFFGCALSPATVLKAAEQAAARVDREFQPLAKRRLAQAPTAHADETGWRVAGKLSWVHSFSDKSFTWIQIHRKRGREAIDHIGIIPRFKGTLVHDCWGPYDTYPGVAAHQLCCAHVLRELQAVADWHAQNRPDDEWCWAAQTAEGIRLAIEDPQQAARGAKLARDALLADDLHHHPPGPTGRRRRALARRLLGRFADYFRFTHTPGLEPTNNPAEQEIRMVKIKAKISGGARTLKGAQTFLSLRSYISTARKHGTTPFTALASLTSQNIWLPATP
jgi:transposase